MAIKFPQLNKTPKNLSEPSVSIASPYAAPIASMDNSAEESVGNYNDSKFYSSSGRIGRIKYLLYPMAFTLVAFLIFGVAMMALGGFVAVSGAVGSGLPITLIIVGLVLLAALFYINIVCAVRRLNDLNRSGWIAILLFVPVISNFFPFYLMLAPGDKGRNDYGLPASPPTTLMKVLAILMFVGVMVIAIGAAIALPAYQQYIEKAQAAQIQAQANKAKPTTPTAQPTNTNSPTISANGATIQEQPNQTTQPSGDLEKPLMVDNTQAPANTANTAVQGEPNANNGENATQPQPIAEAPASNKNSGKVSDEEFLKLSEGKIYADPVRAKK